MNAREIQVKLKLQQKGFTVLRNGWPDFLCIRTTTRKLPGTSANGDPAFEDIRGACAVEVKSRTDQLSPEQQAVRRVLQSARIPVYVVRPDDIDDAIHTSKRRLFLTSEEIRNLHSLAEQAHIRSMQLKAEIKQLDEQVQNIVDMIGEAGAVLSQSASCLEPAPTLHFTPSILGIE